MWFVGCLLAMVVAMVPSGAHAQVSPPTWQRINGNRLDNMACFDTRNSAVFWAKDGNAYNWRTGQQLTNTSWGDHWVYAVACAPSGNVYVHTYQPYIGGAHFYQRTLTQAPTRIEEFPTHVAWDGSGLIYTHYDLTTSPFVLRRSSDNGQHWQDGAAIRSDQLKALYVSPVDAKLVRVLELDRRARPFRMRMYTSTNAGQSWQTSAWRSLDSVCDAEDPSKNADLRDVPGAESIVSWERCHPELQFNLRPHWTDDASHFGSIFSWQMPRHHVTQTVISVHNNNGADVFGGYDFTHYVSVDNGQHWRKQLDVARTFSPYASLTDYHMFNLYAATTANHLVRLYHTQRPGYSTIYDSFSFDVEISTNNGQSWNTVATLSQPSDWPTSDAYRDGSPYDMQVASSVVFNPMLPNNIVAHDSGGIHYSADGGLSWQHLADGHTTRRLVAVTTAHPLTIIRETRSGTFEALTLPNSAASARARGVNHGYSNGFYANETGHDIAPVFLDYWQSNGGLAQFGFPITEPFYESNDDGQTYLVQYFERNRFEHHPELAGTDYEVLLGLIGTRYGAQAQLRQPGPFARQSGASEPGQLYFAETGHTLRNAFKRHWQSTGGLAQYGYPISEEFYEVNPADGQTYVVQYFERARFEWHPELLGTPYEVLLGLLGNQLLADKGW